MLPSRPLSSHPRGSSTSHRRSSASRSGAVRSSRRKCSVSTPLGMTITRSSGTPRMRTARAAWSVETARMRSLR